MPTRTFSKVHHAIAKAAGHCQEILNAGLAEVLDREGRGQTTLTIPDPCRNISFAW